MNSNKNKEPCNPESSDAESPDSAAVRLREIFNKHSSKVLLTDTGSGQEYSYGNIEDLSSRLACYLSNTFGLVPGSKIALLVDNRVESIVLYLACIQAGFISVPINPDFRPYELSKILFSCKTELLVSFAEFGEKLNYLKEASEQRTLIINQDLSLSSLSLSARLSRTCFSKMLNNDIAHIMYSSGTTEVPKAIPIRFGRIIAHAEMFVDFHGLGSDAVFMNTLPLAYLGGWYNLVLVPILAGSSLVLEKAFGPQTMYAFWERVAKHSVNSLWLTPSILSVLLSIGIDEEEIRLYSQNHIRWAMIGMAPLSTALKVQFEEYFKIPLLQSYGLSESFLFSSSRLSEKVPHDSVGTILPGYTVTIENSDSFNPESAGEISVSGPFLFDGYFNQPELTNSCLQKGVLRTGDLGRFDQNGNLYIVGRIKDQIIKAGLNISPLEIESVISGLDGVAEVGVFGNPHPVQGEQVVAVIVRAESETEVDVLSVKRHCRNLLSTAKIPDLILFIDRLPKTPSGKLLRRDLPQFLDTVKSKPSQ